MNYTKHEESLWSRESWEASMKNLLITNLIKKHAFDGDEFTNEFDYAREMTGIDFDEHDIALEAESNA